MRVYFCVLSFEDILLWSSWQNETIWAESMGRLGFQLSAFTFCLFSHFYRWSAFKTVQRWLGMNPVSANNVWRWVQWKMKKPCGQEHVHWGLQTCVPYTLIPEGVECLGTTVLSSFLDILGSHQLLKFLHVFFSLRIFFCVASTKYRDEFWIFVLPCYLVS